ncbi:MAG: (deoxy)nucleoside triphosphate pyrophosphohydrolase [Novosphingobium sp.]
MKRNPTSIEVVAAALVDSEGRILLQLRRQDRQHGGLWEFPGGKVEPGESAASALVRELCEELGVAVFEAALRPLASADDPRTGVVIALYTCRVWGGEPQCLDAAAIGWFTVKEMSDLPMPPLDRPLAAALEQWLQQG